MTVLYLGHHALKLVRDVQFDTIDHEHFQYYSLLSATRALATAGLAIVDVELLPTHEGSLRIWARPSRIAPPPSERVVEVLGIEKAAGMHRVGTKVITRRLAVSLPLRVATGQAGRAAC